MTNDNTLFYKRNTNFRIYPEMNDDQCDNLRKFFLTLTQSEEHDLFWTFSKESNTIIIDESNKNTKDNIFDQLKKIELWLLSKDFYLDGIFYCRTIDKIEFIQLKKYSKTINHQIIYDQIDLSIFLPNDKYDDTIGNCIIEDIKNKLNILSGKRNGACANEQSTQLEQQEQVGQVGQGVEQSQQCERMSFVLRYFNKISNYLSNNIFLRKCSVSLKQNYNFLSVIIILSIISSGTMMYVCRSK